MQKIVEMLLYGIIAFDSSRLNSNNEKIEKYYKTPVKQSILKENERKILLNTIFYSLSLCSLQY